MPHITNKISTETMSKLCHSVSEQKLSVKFNKHIDTSVELNSDFRLYVFLGTAQALIKASFYYISKVNCNANLACIKALPFPGYNTRTTN